MDWIGIPHRTIGGHPDLGQSVRHFWKEAHTFAHECNLLRRFAPGGSFCQHGYADRCKSGTGYRRWRLDYAGQHRYIRPLFRPRPRRILWYHWWSVGFGELARTRCRRVVHPESLLEMVLL
jgi:hypothetical protein